MALCLAVGSCKGSGGQDWVFQELAVVCLSSKKLVEVKAVYEVKQAIQLFPGLRAAAHCSLVQVFQPCAITGQSIMCCHLLHSHEPACSLPFL